MNALTHHSVHCSPEPEVQGLSQEGDTRDEGCTLPQHMRPCLALPGLPVQDIAALLGKGSGELERVAARLHEQLLQVQSERGKLDREQVGGSWLVAGRSSVSCEGVGSNTETNILSVRFMPVHARRTPFRVVCVHSGTASLGHRYCCSAAVPVLPACRYCCAKRCTTWSA